MSAGKKLLIGLFTVAPAILVILVFAMMFSQIPELERMESRPGGAHPDEVFGMLASFLGGIVLAGLFALGTLVFYCVHAYRNPAVREDMRLIWVLIFIFAGFLGNLVYFYLYIVNEPPAVETTPKRDPFGS